jgi:micrococcal nuclease
VVETDGESYHITESAGNSLPIGRSSEVFSQEPEISLPTSELELPYDPFGRDRNCSAFATHAEAQAFFIAAGGPERDPHRLDGDDDGIACESLP